jgi:hypothetical protein
MNFDAARLADWRQKLLDAETRKELSSLWPVDFEKGSVD